jgi:hypothetical protein
MAATRSLHARSLSPKPGSSKGQLKVAKFPWPDPAKIASAGAAVSTVDRPLWRLHTPTGDYPLRWNELRSHGPLASARFDPWQPPAGDRDADPVTTGVGYFAFDLPACLCEPFQTRRVVDRGGGVQLTAFEPTRPLHLLDLRGGWPIAIGASHLINSGPKDRCRAWARAIRSVHPGHDGLIYTGMAGRSCVALYAPPGNVFPALPAFTKPLADPGLDPYIASAAEQIGYGVRPPP